MLIFERKNINTKYKQMNNKLIFAFGLAVTFL